MALNRSTPASPSWARLGMGRSGSNLTTAREVGTTDEITLGHVSDTRAITQTVRYRERLRLPWWFWLPGLGLAALIAAEVNMGGEGLPDWAPYAVLLPVAAGSIATAATPAGTLPARNSGRRPLSTSPRWL